MTTTRSTRSTRATSEVGPPGAHALAQWIYPHSIDEFLSEYWGRRWLHVPGDNNPYLRPLIAGLTDLDRLDQLLTENYSAGAGRFDLVRMGQDGVLISPNEFLTKRVGAVAEVDVGRVLDLHRGGASIILNALHERVAGIGKLCANLSSALGVRAHANAYITPPHGQGFPLHFDSHDVLLLQIAGSKNWRMAPSRVPLATFEARDADDLIPAGPTSEVRLRHGSLLYIPRGMLHEGTTSSELSVHLTIGMNPLVWTDVLHEVLNRLESTDPLFRTSASKEAGEMGAQSTGSFWRELVRRLADSEALADAIAQDLQSHQADSHNVMRGQLVAMHGAIDQRTRVQPNPQRKVAPVRRGDSVVVDFGPGTLTLPSYTWEPVLALTSGTATRVTDIPQGLDPDAGLRLVEQLVKLGILLVVEQGPSRQP